VLQRGVVTPDQIDYARGISGLRVVKDLGAVERLGIVGARQELCAHIWYVPTCAGDRSFWPATVNDVLIASQDCHGRAANELQVCRFRETPRVSCIEVTRWRPMLRSRESGRTKRTYRSGVSSAPSAPWAASAPAAVARPFRMYSNPTAMVAPIIGPAR
jgi:hypothetical protein